MFIFVLPLTMYLNWSLRKVRLTQMVSSLYFQLFVFSKIVLENIKSVCLGSPPLDFTNCYYDNHIYVLIVADSVF